MALLLVLAFVACNPPLDTGPKGTRDLDVPALVPLPVLVEDGKGSYTLDEHTTLAASGTGADVVAALLADALRPATGLALDVVVGEAGGIVLFVDEGLPLDDEAYTLDVTEDGVVIAARTEAGLFYGAQTLRQLLSPLIFSASTEDVGWRVPVVHIEDAPRFPWRGFMLDVARHFFTMDEVKRQIDLLALHKLNRLHLHLTDDQGWRIEIASWPALTEIGGATEVGGGASGWYSQADYAEIVAYAAARHVTVVPEIDFPGHAHAALASYGELNESGVPEEPYTGAGVISTPLWLEGPATRPFVEDVWREVAALTPGEWLHVGGDEAIGVDDGVYDAFVTWLQTVVEDEGKTLVGWDEIGGVSLEPPYAAQHWYDEDNARRAAARGGVILSSPAEHTYLDMVHDGDAEFGQTWAGAVGVERAYDWEPVPTGLDELDVIGVEAPLWTEYVHTGERLDFMAWPRLAAIAEVGWSRADQREWADFAGRLGWHGARLDVLGVGFYHSPEVVWTAPEDAR